MNKQAAYMALRSLRADRYPTMSLPLVEKIVLDYEKPAWVGYSKADFEWDIIVHYRLALDILREQRDASFEQYATAIVVILVSMTIAGWFWFIFWPSLGGL